MKLNKEDIEKFGTLDEIKLLTEIYDDIDEIEYEDKEPIIYRKVEVIFDNDYVSLEFQGLESRDNDSWERYEWNGEYWHNPTSNVDDRQYSKNELINEILRKVKAEAEQNIIKG